MFIKLDNSDQNSMNIDALRLSKQQSFNKLLGLKNGSFFIYVLVHTYI